MGGCPKVGGDATKLGGWPKVGGDPWVCWGRGVLSTGVPKGLGGAKIVGGVSQNWGDAPKLGEGPKIGGTVNLRETPGFVRGGVFSTGAPKGVGGALK